VASLSPLFVDRAEYGGSYLFWIGVTLLVHLPFTAIMLGSRFLFFHRSPGASRPAVVLCTFFMAQAVRGFLLGNIVVASGLTDDPKFVFRIFAGYLVIGGSLQIIAVVLASTDEHVAQLTELQLLYRRIIDATVNLDDRVREGAARLISYIQRELEPPLHELVSDIAHVEDDDVKHGVVDGLTRFESEHLRPMLRELERTAGEVRPIEEDRSVLQRGTFFPRLLDPSLAMDPRLNTAVFFVLNLAASQRSLTPLESVRFLAVYGSLTFALFTLAFRLTSGRKLPILLTVVIVLAVFTGLTPFALSVQEFAGVTVPSYILLPEMIFGILLGSFNLMYVCVTNRRESLERELAEALTVLQDRETLLRQELWLQRRKAATVLHGSVQSALTVASIRLRNEGDITRDERIILAANITEALRLIESDNNYDGTIQQFCRDLTSLWSGIIEINFAISRDICDLLNVHKATRSVVVEAFKEVVSNAVKHGHADSIWIAVEMTGHSLQLTARDDGNGPSDSPIPRGGSLLLDEISSHWSLSGDDFSGAVVRAELPVQFPDVH
jgi:signal transduction histidine kinase